MFRRKPRIRIRIRVAGGTIDDVREWIAEADKLRKLHPNIIIEIEFPDV